MPFFSTSSLTHFKHWTLKHWVSATALRASIKSKYKFPNPASDQSFTSIHPGGKKSKLLDICIYILQHKIYLQSVIVVSLLDFYRHCPALSQPFTKRVLLDQHIQLIHEVKDPGRKNANSNKKEASPDKEKVQCQAKYVLLYSLQVSFNLLTVILILHRP